MRPRISYCFLYHLCLVADNAYDPLHLAIQHMSFFKLEDKNAGNGFRGIKPE